MAKNHTDFDTVLDENELFSKLVPPEVGSRSRMAIYEKTIRNLPLPPALWDKFQRACKKDESNQKLGKIIKDDPVLAASILRIANAPGLGVRIEITDVGRAVSHLGISLVRTIVSRHSFSAGPAQSAKVYDIRKLWKHGMAVSALAEIIADYIPDCHIEEAATLGLFHDIGKMALNLFPEFIQPASLETNKGHLMYEYERFSCTHIDLGVLLAKHWQLPEKIIQGIAYHHHPAYAEIDAIPHDIRAEVFAVYLADLLAIHMGFDTGDSGIVLPHESFSSMLQGTTLVEIMHSQKVIDEMKRIETIEF
ncbi:MAG: HDOD domain-containing protein [Mariprofundaceae bacterium]|nr:HDOD domain-containing protein [Mariprofundaceae bacterium]